MDKIHPIFGFPNSRPPDSCDAAILSRVRRIPQPLNFWHFFPTVLTVASLQ